MVQGANKQLKEVRDRALEREEHFEKELATAQKLAALYKTSVDDRTARAAELEGVVRELKEHVQVLHASQHIRRLTTAHSEVCRSCHTAHMASHVCFVKSQNWILI